MLLTVIYFSLDASSNLNNKGNYDYVSRGKSNICCFVCTVDAA